MPCVGFYTSTNVEMKSIHDRGSSGFFANDSRDKRQSLCFLTVYIHELALIKITENVVHKLHTRAAKSKDHQNTPAIILLPK